MSKSRLFLCNGAPVPLGYSDSEREVTELFSFGKDPNVHIGIENLTSRFQGDLPPRLFDLLEIASFVFTADCATKRGSAWENDGTLESWDRDFVFSIAVRDYEFWKNDEVRDALARTLSFLSDDKFAFFFHPANRKEDGKQLYLHFSQSELEKVKTDRIAMFSGGLDSLAGAVEGLTQGENIILVSHRSVATIDKRQRTLVGKLRDKFPKQVSLCEARDGAGVEVHSLPFDS